MSVFETIVWAVVTLFGVIVICMIIREILIFLKGIEELKNNDNG